MPYAFDHPHDLPHDEAARLLGGKGASLWAMTRRLGLPVPPGFTLPTPWCLRCLDGGLAAPDRDAVRGAVQALERRLGRRYGEGPLPLLLSVRSGAAASMPGMMDTVLNVGLTGSAAQALAAATGNPRFVAESRLRFLRSYAQIVLGEPASLQPPEGADPLAAWHAHLAARIGEAALEDPWQQLFTTIEAVFRSWNSPRARHYRERESLQALQGTAVNVQAMVFGNLDDRSGTGVLFTRDPMTGAATPRADWLPRAQGDDVVSGTHRTQDLAALADALPDVHAELLRAASSVEGYYRDMADIEFTVEAGRLWILQARVGKRSPAAAARIAVEMQRDPRFGLSRAEALRRVPAEVLEGGFTLSRIGPEAAEPLARGIGASPGVARGRIVFDPDTAVDWAERGEDVILVRRETAPEDVHGMGVARGIVTTLGGLMSHAAVVARAWGIPAVVGAAAIVIDDRTLRVGDVLCREGDPIALDGSSGCIYAEAVQAQATAADPHVAELRRWREPRPAA